MFFLDMPNTLPQNTPIVLAQAVATGSAPQWDFILNDCQETPSTGDPKSAMRAVDPAYMLKNYIQGRDNRVVELSDIKNVSMLQATQHGKLLQGTSNLGRTTFHYDPIPDYEGTDKAVFMADYQGKRYRIVVEMHVFEVVDESASTCPPAKLIKVTKPSSGWKSYNLNVITVSYQPNPAFKRDSPRSGRAP
jgi:hypothetical protein